MSRKIIGVTVGTQLPKPNFKQNDPTKGDYIKNKPDFEGLESRIDTMSNLVGDTKVSDQIANAIVNKVDKVDGQRLITTDEADKLKALVIGENGQVGISGTVNADNVQGLAEKLALKVDKVDGKGLSTNDYTTAEKNKLAAIDTGANKTVVDSELSETSTNPVQNKVVNEVIDDLYFLVGDGTVSEQISDALNSYNADMNAAHGEAGHIVHRTHYSEYVATLLDNVVMDNNITSSTRDEFCYNDIKDYDELTVVFDGVVYECPITVRTSITDAGDESYFYAGNWSDSDPRYPFYILGYLSQDAVLFGVGEGEHTVSVKLSEVAKKLDVKYLPDEVFAASDWNAAEGETGHILNRTHYKETNIVDIVPSGSFTLDEYAYCMTEANGRLVAGKTYVATIDGVKYERVATYDEEFEAAYIGNLDVFWGNESENPDDDAFCFMVAEDGMADISLVSSDYANKTITFSVQEFTEVIHKLPLEYLDMPDMDAAEGKPGHVLNRTHYSEPEVILADNVEITTSGMYSWISYNAIKDYEEITVVYDGTTYVCPITFGIDTTDYDSKYFKFGSWNDAECPFSFVGYETLEYAAVTVPEGSHTLSVMAGEYVKKLDKKYLPDDIDGGVSSWNDLTDKPFYMESSEVVLLDGEFTTEYIDTYGVFGIDTAYNEELEAAPEKVTMVYDGVEYKDITFTDIPDLGKVGGNLYHMNALFGTSYEDTGEPFILAVTKYGCAIMTLDTAETVHVVKLFIAGEGEPTEKINPSCLPDGYPYVEGGTVEFLPETTLTADENGEILIPTDNFVFEVGMTYAITYNGTSYTCTAVDIATLNLSDVEGIPAGSVVLGNYEAMLGTGDTGEPFVIMYLPGMACIIYDRNELTSVTVSISRTGEVVHKLDNKYIDAEWMATGEKVVKGDAILAEKEYELTQPSTGLAFPHATTETFTLEENDYIVEFDGVSYTLAVHHDTGSESGDVYYLGNSSIISENNLDTGEPFCVCVWPLMGGCFVAGTAGTHTLAIYKVVKDANKLPMKYLPEGYPYTDESGTIHKLDNKYINAEWMATTDKQAREVLIPEIELEFAENNYVAIIEGETAERIYSQLVSGATYIVSIDGTEFVGTMIYDVAEASWGIVIEQIGMVVFFDTQNISIYVNGTTGTHTFAFYKVNEEPDKLPVKYLPDGVPYEKVININTTFDGNYLDKEFIWDNESQKTYLVKISPEVLTKEEVIGSTFVWHFNGSDIEYTVKESNIINANSYGTKPPVFILDKDGNSTDIYFVEYDCFYYDKNLTAGIWFRGCDSETSSFYAKSLSCMSSQLDESRKLSPNLLPESVATKEYINIRVPAWTDADEGKFLRIVNGTPTWVSIPDAKAGEY